MIKIPYSDSEQENQRFIKTTPIERDVPNSRFRFDYFGYHGCESYCYLEIHKSVVIAIAPPINEEAGTSITNLAEHLATRVCHRFNIDPKFLIWVEFYPKYDKEAYLFGKPSYDLVQFNLVDTQYGPRFISPRWTRISMAAADALKEGK